MRIPQLVRSIRALPGVSGDVPTYRDRIRSTPIEVTCRRQTPGLGCKLRAGHPR